MRLQSIDLRKNKVVFAGFFSRAGAFLIDMILVLAIVGPLKLVDIFLFPALGVPHMNRPVLFWFSGMDLVCYVLMSVYFVMMTYCFGKTLGKMAVNIRVVSLRDTNRTFGDILYRETVGRYLSSLFFIGYLISAVHPQKAALHDRICKTRVVEKVSRIPDESEPSPPERET